MKLTGPGRKSSRITRTTKLKNLIPGTYTVSAQAVVAGASTYQPTIAVCSASARCSSPSHGHITVKAHRSVTVRVTYAVTKPKAVGTPQSPASPGASPQPSPGGMLAAGQSETGGWSTSIYVPAGGPQAQADAVISYPIALNEKPKVEYLNEARVKESGTRPNCPGNANGPKAEPGYLCVFQGAIAVAGSLETEWKNAGFLGLANFSGELNQGGKIGELVIFRTKEFNEEAPGSPIIKAALLNAAGSWAVTEKG